MEFGFYNHFTDEETESQELRKLANVKNENGQDEMESLIPVLASYYHEATLQKHFFFFSTFKTVFIHVSAA